MSLYMQWVWYVLAFGLGSMVAWLLAVVTVKHTSEEDAVADLPGSRELGGQ